MKGCVAMKCRGGNPFARNRLVQSTRDCPKELEADQLFWPFLSNKLRIQRARLVYDIETQLDMESLRSSIAVGVPC